jgi:hypothetical protein
MARYDPYDRGDNPWIGNLDMPRSNPSAKPGAGRASKTAPKKKEPPLDPNLRWTSGKITRDAGPGTGLPKVGPAGAAPPRPVGIGETQGPPIPPELLLASQPSEGPMPMPPPPDPVVTGGILGGPPPGADPRSARAAELAAGPAPPSPMPIMNSAANNPAALRPTQTTGADQMGASLMNYLRSQLFNQGRPVQ